MSCICDICNTKVSNKYNLTKHKFTESCQKIKREIEYSDNIQNINNKLINNQNQEEE